VAALALVNSQIAAAAGATTWACIEWMRLGKPSALGFASGLVAGLVAITPAAGFVGPMAAIAIGLCAGAICYGGVLAKNRFGYDDTLDAFGVHGVRGAFGALATGVFAAKVWNAAGADGLMAGRALQLLQQALATLAAAAYAGGLTFVLLKVLDRVIGLRVSEEEEYEGLDLNLHGEQGYSLGVTGHGHVEREAQAASPTAEPALVFMRRYTADR
jgi:Amt family ammonium transporter